MADDYKAKLEQFCGLVPKSAKATQINRITGTEYYGEIPSGTPVVQVKSKEDLAAVKTAAKGPIVNNATFQTLTDLTHFKLLNNWKDGGQLTSCNAFVMKAGQAMGVPGLGGFYV